MDQSGAALSACVASYGTQSGRPSPYKYEAHWDPKPEKVVSAREIGKCPAGCGPTATKKWNDFPGEKREDMSPKDLATHFGSGPSSQAADADGWWRFDEDDRYTDALRASASHQRAVYDAVRAMRVGVPNSTVNVRADGSPLDDLRTAAGPADSPDLAESILGVTC
jgi:hypothetical protein